MSNFEPGKKPVEFCGYVVSEKSGKPRAWVSPGGKYGTLTLDVPGERGGGKYDFRCFADGPLSGIGALQVGQLVKVTCSVDMEKLTAKDRTPVKVDGWERWVPALTIRSMEVQSESEAAAATDNLSW